MLVAGGSGFSAVSAMMRQLKDSGEVSESTVKVNKAFTYVKLSVETPF